MTFIFRWGLPSVNTVSAPVHVDKLWFFELWVHWMISLPLLLCFICKRILSVIFPNFCIISLFISDHDRPKPTESSLAGVEHEVRIISLSQEFPSNSLRLSLSLVSMTKFFLYSESTGRTLFLFMWAHVSSLSLESIKGPPIGCDVCFIMNIVCCLLRVTNILGFLCLLK